MVRSVARARPAPVLAGVIAIAWLAAPAAGQTDPPCFLGLGDLPGGAVDSSAYALSADGSTVVGSSVSSTALLSSEAFRWRADSGMVGLGGTSGGFDTWATGVSGDGEIVVGSRAKGGDLIRLPPLAFRWTAAGGMVSLGDLPGGSDFSRANAVSDDGTIIAGVTSADDFRASIWTAGGGWQQVDGEEGESSFYGLARSGHWACGIKSPGDATRWSAATGLQRLGDLAGGPFGAYAYAISDDGRIVIGNGRSASGQEAFRWTAASGMVGLGDFADGTFCSTAYGMTADGTLIVGQGTTAAGREAALWDSDLTMTRLADVLADHGVEIPEGWMLERATDVVINGDIVSICGTGMNPAGHREAWIARYCLPLPTGACCLGSGGCVELTQADCDTLADGTWRGPGTDCTDADEDGVAELCACALGDVQCDGDLDLVDFAALAACCGEVPPGPHCATFDANFDAAVDVADLVLWAERMTGPQAR